MKNSFNELKTRNILSKEQMKNIRGGGTCGYYIEYADGSYDADCYRSKAEVDHMVNGTKAQKKYWCCDSCATTFYCGGSSSFSGSNLQTSFQWGVTCP